jgi:uncharacterized protein YdaU (DUF1376 family)
MKEEKKTRKAPAFQLYTDDFLAGTLEMSQAEVGQLIRLLCHQWNRGSIPVETEKQQRLAGGCVSVEVLAKFDECEDGLLRNKRLESVRTERGVFLQQQSQKGKLSAEKRRLAALAGQPNTQPEINQSSTAVQPEGQPEGQPDIQPEFNSPSPSPKNKEEAPEKAQWEVKYGLMLPENLQTDECLSAVETWLAYKAERKQGYKRIGLSAALKAWSSEYNSATFPAAVMHSIASNYQGIFPPRTALPAPTGKSAPNPNDPTDIRNYL